MSVPALSVERGTASPPELCAPACRQNAMSQPLVECIPNFSEGRRPEVIQAIVRAMQQADAIHVLDVSSDADHNRTVVTFVGPPHAVERAMFAGIQKAAALIDMTQHTGAHPRLGATDVVPFVPIRQTTMNDCVEIALRLGQRVGEQLGIPVYLYEAAASRPERQNLADLRNAKFQFEQLREAIVSDPAHMPDFGPAQIGTAGATVIGARAPLVAYNVYLSTDQVEIATRIARAIRHSSGGLRYVKAYGLLVDGRAQVSINLTNYQKTPVHRVVEMIRSEAARYGVSVAFSELVGLAPQEFFVEAARWYLQLDRFESDQILEYRIQKAESEVSALAAAEPPIPEDAAQPVIAVEPPPRTPAPFVAAVAEGTPTPGGGAVAALAGALSAALAEMVARLTIGKQRYAEVEPTMQAIAPAAAALRQHLLGAIDQDIAAFEAVLAALRLPKDDPARAAAIQAATIGAADVPLTVARQALQAMELAEQVVRLGNVNAVSDGASAVLIGLAAVEAAALNVRVNAASIDDRGLAQRYQHDAIALVSRARELRQAVIAVAEQRAGIAGA